MNCECNNKSNRVKPGIKHVYGNVLRMAIPLTLRTLVKDGDEMDVTDTDFIPSSDHPVRVVFSKGKTNYPIIATMDGNVAIVEDKGKIPVGTYDISVECYDDLGNPYRFKQNAVLYVADTTAEAGIDEEIEYEAQTWYLNAAVFLATTEIGEIGDVIDAKLDDVFGNVAYDADAKEIRFYNKGNSKVLATIDSSPFIADGTVADVYIDVSRQVLVVVLNEDAGGRMFSVPLYLVFNSYYKKDEVDSLVSRTVEGLRFDFSQELPLVVPVTKNGSSYSSPVDFGSIENAIREDGRLVVACVNNVIFYQLLVADRAEIAFTRVVALDGYQELLVVDKSNVWSMEDVDLGTGGGGGYEPPAGGIPKTDLASGVQASLNKADTALQQSDLDGYATTDDVDNAVAALVSSAPQTLDTLKELADALGDDPNFATTMATQLGNKVDKETGKGLSTNDYTTAEKTKLAGIDPSTYATKTEVNAKQDTINDLDAIRSGAALGATALQSYTETDPTVPAWAKASSKPSYTASEVGAVPTTRKVNNKALSSDITLTASDVGAMEKVILHFEYDEQNDEVYFSDYGGHELTHAEVRSICNSGAYIFLFDTNAGLMLIPRELSSDSWEFTYGGGLYNLSVYLYWDSLNSCITCSNYEEEFGVPISRTINSKALTNDIILTSSDVGAVPTTRTVNGKRLNNNIVIGMDDIPGLAEAISEAGEVKSVTINGTNHTPNSSGVIDLGTVITAHQDISGKANKSEMSVSKGTGTNAGKTTITLTSETGKSATLLDSTHPAASITDANKTAWNNKQSAINDLDTIRSGAAAGATSVQTISVNGASLSPTDGNISISAVTGLQFDGSTHVGAVQLPEYVKKSDYDTTIDDIYQSIPSDLADMADDATHRLVNDTEKNTWNGKQDAISDLATIRSGASKGATAIQQADLAAVATSGSYNDLTNKPTIPAAQVNSDWNATSGVSRILNKPTIPTVPTKVSSFTNDAGYLTQHQSLANYYTKSEIDTKIGNVETLLASI